MVSSGPGDGRLPLRCQVRPPSVVWSMWPSVPSAYPWSGDTNVADTTAADAVDGAEVVGVDGSVVVAGCPRRRVVVDVVARGTVVVDVLTAGFEELEQPAIATTPRTIAATPMFRPFVFMGVSLPSRLFPRR